MFFLWIFLLLIPQVKCEDDYDALVHYADIASLAYCLKKGLGTGIVGDEGNCPLSKCLQDQYKYINVISKFNFNEMGQVGSGYYGIDEKRQEILLAFRGTSSRRDWVTNIDSIPTSYDPLINLKLDKHFDCNGCTVHRGFYNFLKKNLAGILSAVKQIKEENPDFKVVVVGHSLGGALALLSGIEFQLMGYEPLLVSFAGPKIGNSQMMEFVDSLFESHAVAKKISQLQNFEKGYIRVVHKNDIVPLIPPYFSHGGVEYYIEKKELPHTREDLNRVGVKVHTLAEEDINRIEVEAQTVGELPNFNIGKLWPDALGKSEHTTYFTRISGCREE